MKPFSLCLSKIIEALSGSSFECQTPLKNRMKNNTVIGWNVHSLSVKQSEKLFSRSTTSPNYCATTSPHATDKSPEVELWQSCPLFNQCD